MCCNFSLQCGIVLALLMLCLSGFLVKFTSYFLLKSAVLARRRSYETLAFQVFGPAGKLAVEVCVIGFLAGTCIAFFVVIGDLAPPIGMTSKNISFIWACWKTTQSTTLLTLKDYLKLS